MAESEVQVANMALRHLGISETISDLETERTKQALACRTFFDQTRDEVFQEFPWPFATLRGALGLVATDPDDEWGYSYRKPADALAFWHIWNGVTRTDTRATRVVFKPGADATGGLIFTDQADAIGEWTIRVEDVTQWPPLFAQAVALKLALYITPSVTSTDQDKLAQRVAALYAVIISQAKTLAANEGAQDQAPESEFITVRE